jgi:hypothetical protein
MFSNIDDRNICNDTIRRGNEPPKWFSAVSRFGIEEPPRFVLLLLILDDGRDPLAELDSLDHRGLESLHADLDPDNVFQSI